MSSTQDPGGSCPTCGAPVERGQLVCLTCGGRVGLQFKKPPRWQWPVALAAAVVALAVVGVFVALQLAGGEADDEVAAGRASQEEARRPAEPAQQSRTTDTTEPATTETEPEEPESSDLATAKRGPTAVLSGVPTPGAAKMFASKLRRQGFTVGEVTNAPTGAGDSSVLYTRGLEDAAKALSEKAGIIEVRPVDPATAEKGRGAKLYVIVGARP